MGFKIPFTKAWYKGLEEKALSNFYPLTSTNVSNLVGFESLTNTQQNEQKLINKGYGENVTVHAIIKKIAQSGADIPKVLIDLNDPEEVIEEGELFDILQEPGLLQGEKLSQYDYFETLLTYLLASGNTYQLGLFATGFGDVWQQMEILPSGLTVPNVGNSYRQGPVSYNFQDKQNTITFLTEDVLQTKYVNPTTLGLNSLEGLSPLQAALYSLTGSTDIQKAISIMVKNQGVRGVLSNDSNRQMTPEQADKMKVRANEQIRGVDKFNKVHVSNTKMSYTQMGMNATDLKVIESGVLTDRQLCNAYSCPSVLFNDPANSTYNNYTTALKSLYTDAVIPNCNKILEDANRVWLKQWSERDGKRYSWQLDTSGIEALQSDQKEEAEKDNLIMDGVTKILAMPNSQEGKIKLLMDTYGYSEEAARMITEPTNTIDNE